MNNSPKLMRLTSEYLDLESLAWRELKSASFPARYEHAAIGVRDRLVVFGGARAEGPLSDTWRYNFGKLAD